MTNLNLVVNDHGNQISEFAISVDNPKIIPFAFEAFSVAQTLYDFYHPGQVSNSIALSVTQSQCGEDGVHIQVDWNSLILIENADLYISFNGTDFQLAQESIPISGQTGTYILLVNGSEIACGLGEGNSIYIKLIQPTSLLESNVTQLPAPTGCGPCPNRNGIIPSSSQNLNVNTPGASLTIYEQPNANSREWKWGTQYNGPFFSFAPPEIGFSYTPIFSMVGSYYVVCFSDFGNEIKQSNLVIINVIDSSPPPTFITLTIVGISSGNNEHTYTFNITGNWNQAAVFYLQYNTDDINTWQTGANIWHNMSFTGSVDTQANVGTFTSPDPYTGTGTVRIGVNVLGQTIYSQVIGMNYSNLLPIPMPSNIVYGNNIVTFNWLATGSNNYQFLLSTSQDMSNPVQRTSATTSVDFAWGELIWNQTYYYTIANLMDPDTTPSSPASFVHEACKFNILNNFNGTSTISVNYVRDTLPEISSLKVKYYDDNTQAWIVFYEFTGLPTFSGIQTTQSNPIIGTDVLTVAEITFNGYPTAYSNQVLANFSAAIVVHLDSVINHADTGFFEISYTIDNLPMSPANLIATYSNDGGNNWFYLSQTTYIGSTGSFSAENIVEGSVLVRLELTDVQYVIDNNGTNLMFLSNSVSASLTLPQPTVMILSAVFDGGLYSVWTEEYNHLQGSYTTYQQLSLDNGWTWNEMGQQSQPSNGLNYYNIAQYLGCTQARGRIRLNVGGGPDNYSNTINCHWTTDPVVFLDDAFPTDPGQSGYVFEIRNCHQGNQVWIEYSLNGVDILGTTLLGGGLANDSVYGNYTANNITTGHVLVRLHLIDQGNHYYSYFTQANWS